MEDPTLEKFNAKKTMGDLVIIFKTANELGFDMSKLNMIEAVKLRKDILKVLFDSVAKEL